ncbi:hypothetical protein CRM22_009059 [Opisthorchis felineus]|uniref:Uncharacterized protein n=1 Tax=Opisthorchis felineus TaxID=147828 RepID=A0A4S2L941_OPIFE|nr:hypothetical protein CRM22_009059 [Opisthorchis felineus]
MKNVGMKNVKYDKWKHLVKQVKRECESGGLRRFDPDDSKSFWLVPCINCGNASTCHWNESIWIPDARMSSCLYDEALRASNHKDLRDLLRNKQLLFVGDSTLRDLMLALVEQVNGTLTFGSPTHGYLNITQPYVLRAGFAYFPDYGLSRDNQSTFMDHVKNLFRLYANSRYIILIFGGAQWLAKPMLKALADFLQSWYVVCVISSQGDWISFTNKASHATLDN